MSITLACDALCDALDGFEPKLYSGDDAAALAEKLALTERVCATARARAAAWAAECGAHRGRGYARPIDWLSKVTGTDPGQAKRELDTAQALDDLPDTKDALNAGEVSLAEASEVAKCPEAEDELLALAKTHDHRALKDRARRRALENQKGDLKERRQKARGIRTYTDDLGMTQVRGSLLPELGARFVARLREESEREWRDGNRDCSPEQRAHDALARMLDGTGGKAGRRPELVAVYDLNERSAHIPGMGPIDPETLKDIAVDALVSVVLHDGVHVQDIKRFGTYIPRWLEILLEIGPPPHFEGARCADCGAIFAFERDHANPRANGGATSYLNMEPRCPPCHRKKTEEDREAGLLGPLARPPRPRGARASKPRASRPERARAP
ncbi:MAG: DUF222 domain-containing protein [Actinobacteria bacterium]|nr:DUF222 domain-containing protein [Actinomycetota bacterium]